MGGTTKAGHDKAGWSSLTSLRARTVTGISLVSLLALLAPAAPPVRAQEPDADAVVVEAEPTPPTSEPSAALGTIRTSRGDRL